MGNKAQKRVANNIVNRAGAIAEQIAEKQILTNSLTNNPDFATSTEQQALNIELTAELTDLQAEKQQNEAILVDGVAFPYTSLLS